MMIGEERYHGRVILARLNQKWNRTLKTECCFLVEPHQYLTFLLITLSWSSINRGLPPILQLLIVYK